MSKKILPDWPKEQAFCKTCGTKREVVPEDEVPQDCIEQAELILLAAPDDEKEPYRFLFCPTCNEYSFQGPPVINF